MISRKNKLFAGALVLLAFTAELAIGATVGYNPAECRKIESVDQK